MNNIRKKLNKYIEQEKIERGLIDIKVTIVNSYFNKEKLSEKEKDDKIDKICNTVLYALKTEAKGNYTIVNEL